MATYRERIDALLGQGQQKPVPTQKPVSASVPLSTEPPSPNLELQGVTISNGRPSVRFAPKKEDKPEPTPKPKPVPQGQMTALESTNKAIGRLQELIKLQSEKNFNTGPFTPKFYRGTIGNVVMQYGGTPEERVFKAQNERFVNDYLTAQTGAQRGFKEMQWLQTAIPNPSQDTPENYIANAKSALADLIRNRDQMLQMLEETGYKAPIKSSQGIVGGVTKGGIKYQVER